MSPRGKETGLSVSVVIPTLNAEKTLESCLGSIREQEYSGRLEIVVADGGSRDCTLSIAKSHGCRVVDNPLKTGESGKAKGVKAATGEIVALIDSDNILPDSLWLQRMTAPFADPLIAGSEPLWFEYRRSDAPLTRYCALIGMNDPICYFFKNYDRQSALSGLWTGLSIPTAEREGYLEVRLEPGVLPTMGANGFLVRKSLLDELQLNDYLFDIDVVHDLVTRGNNLFAKVKTGIVHLYGTGLRDFTRKQLRRVRDYNYYRTLEMRSYPWGRQKALGLARFIVYCLFVVPLLAQSFRGYLRKPDPAWALHAPACLLTLIVYAWGTIEGRVRPAQQKRAGWKQ